MFTQLASHNRFNLLLLSEGEHYFSDYAAIFYPNCATDAEAVSKCVLYKTLVFCFPIPMQLANSGCFSWFVVSLGKFEDV